MQRQLPRCVHPPFRRRHLPTGFDIASHHGTPVVIGMHNGYNWLKHEITLTRDVAEGREPVHVLIASHELAHSIQSKRIHALRFLHPVRWWSEMKAWEYAVNFFASAWRLSNGP